MVIPGLLVPAGVHGPCGSRHDNNNNNNVRLSKQDSSCLLAQSPLDLRMTKIDRVGRSLIRIFFFSRPYLFASRLLTHVLSPAYLITRPNP